MWAVVTVWSLRACDGSGTETLTRNKLITTSTNEVLPFVAPLTRNPKAKENKRPKSYRKKKKLFVCGALVLCVCVYLNDSIAFSARSSNTAEAVEKINERRRWHTQNRCFHKFFVSFFFFIVFPFRNGASSSATSPLMASQRRADPFEL